MLAGYLSALRLPAFKRKINYRPELRIFCGRTVSQTQKLVDRKQ